MAIFKKEKKVQQPQQMQGPVMQVNLVDVVKQAAVQMKYEEIGSWLMMHKTPLFFCHDKGLSIVDRNFIDDRLWLKKAMSRMIKEIDEMKQKAVQQAQGQQQAPGNSQAPAESKAEKEEKTGYFG
jgi:fructose-specific phosphotransferase system component IIB